MANSKIQANVKRFYSGSVSTLIVPECSGTEMYIAFTAGGDNPQMTNSLYGCLVLVTGNAYGVIHKGSEITVRKNSDNRIEITCSKTTLKMGWYKLA